MSFPNASTSPKGSNAQTILQRLLAQDTTELDRSAFQVFAASILAGKNTTIDANMPFDESFLDGMPKGWQVQLNDKLIAIRAELEDSIANPSDYSEDLGDDGCQVHSYDIGPNVDELFDQVDWLNTVINALPSKVQSTKQSTTSRLAIS